MAERIRGKKHSCVDCQNSVYVQYMFVGHECTDQIKKTVATDPRPPDVRNE